MHRTCESASNHIIPVAVELDASSFCSAPLHEIFPPFFQPNNQGIKASATLDTIVTQIIEKITQKIHSGRSC
jgi:hypothetical protein